MGLAALCLGILLPFTGHSAYEPAEKVAERPSTKVELSPDWIKELKWRSIGPANMGGRVTAVAIYEADPTTWWAATASGGLLKTTNNGVTFEHQFDSQTTVSIGDVAVAQSNRNIVWVGTGENNPRNSVSYGDGVYKSIDGGKTWKNMGLRKSFQIGRIAIHPKNPDIVYVGAVGRLYGPNEERGLFKTTDGGKTWNKLLYIDEKTGVIDVQMNPADPETVLWPRPMNGSATATISTIRSRSGARGVACTGRAMAARTGKNSRVDCRPALWAESGSITTARTPVSSSRWSNRRGLAPAPLRPLSRADR
jgi:hypothetical protein